VEWDIDVNLVLERKRFLKGAKEPQHWSMAQAFSPVFLEIMAVLNELAYRGLMHNGLWHGLFCG
jgi:hypothetical protein